MIVRTPFDIFKKDQQGNFVWLEAATDLHSAKARLKELATKVAGEYVVFDEASAQIIERFTQDDFVEH